VRDQEYRRAGADAHGRSASRTPQPQKRHRRAVCQNQILRESETRGVALQQLQRPQVSRSSNTTPTAAQLFAQRPAAPKPYQNHLSLPPRERRQPQAGITLYGHHLLPLPRVRCRARFTIPCVRRCRTRKKNLDFKKGRFFSTFRNLEKNHAHAKLHFRNE